VAPSYIQDPWTDGCTDFASATLQEICSGNNGSYRAFGATTLFFLIAAVAAACRPTANREAWPAKFVLFLFLCAGTIFIPNEPLFSSIYLNIARIGGVLFIALEQIIILDMAYEWNDSWVTKADSAEAEEAGSGKKWLTAILFSCAILFVCSFVSIVLMFAYFSGCATNNALISVTLILGILITIAQLSGEEGSLLSSGCIFAWATYLCYTAISKNPDKECNPMLKDANYLSIILGLTVTVISLGWTGWSYTAEDKLVRKSDDGEEETSPDEEQKVTGVVVGESYGTNQKEDTASEDSEDVDSNTMDNPKRLSNSWKLNIVLATVACWTAMALTNWGAIVANGSVANPSAGKIGMWMVIASQWLVVTLYFWTLVAPRLFPDRDFS